MFQIKLFLPSLLVALILSFNLTGQVQVINSNSLYDLCCKFRNSTAYQIVLLPTEDSAQFENILNGLELGAIKDPSDCINSNNPYEAMLFFAQSALVKQVTLILGGNNEPIFQLTN